MKILYIDGVGPFGGASRSLYELVRALTDLGVEPYFIMASGTSNSHYFCLAKDSIVASGICRFDNTRASFYRGFRWLIPIREIYFFPPTLVALIRARLRWKEIDMIHVNEITEIIPAVLAKLIFQRPVLIHVRSVQRNDKNSLRTRFINFILNKYISKIVAIDETVKASLNQEMQVEVVHNSYTPSPLNNTDESIVKNLEYGVDTLVVGFVGNLHVAKGIFDLIYAAGLVKSTGRNVKYLVAGGFTRNDKGIKGWLLKKFRLAQNLENEILLEIAKANVENEIVLLGPVSNIETVYSAIDVLCFPSHYDAPGRPIFEAAMAGVPCITCIKNPLPDTVVPHVTGIVVPEKRPSEIADAIIYLYDNRDKLVEMGNAAKNLGSKNFNAINNSIKMKRHYEALLSGKT